MEKISLILLLATAVLVVIAFCYFTFFLIFLKNKRDSKSFCFKLATLLYANLLFPITLSLIVPYEFMIFSLFSLEVSYTSAFFQYALPLSLLIFTTIFSLVFHY